jgi:hypothetical protein
VRFAIVGKKRGSGSTGGAAAEDVAGVVRRAAMKATAAIVTVLTATTPKIRSFDARLVFIEDFLVFIAHSS